MRWMRHVAALAGVMTAVGLGACGSSGPSSSALGSGSLQRAADVTAKLPGYRLAASVSVSTPAGAVQSGLTGSIDRTTDTGDIVAEEQVAGRQVSFQEVFSGLTFYLKTGGISGLASLTHGKSWVKFDMSKLLGSIGLGGLPTTGTDPSQFVDFLRAVSSSTTKLGTATIRGVPTTHYRATIDLSRYPSLVPAAHRAQARGSVATLEKTLGGSKMPIEAWVDRNNLVRRIAVSYRECVANQHVQFSMTMDLFDFGPQAVTSVPSAADAFDLTPQLSGLTGQLKLGCTSG